MNDLEKIILEETSTLPDMRLIEVIGFIRYLKGARPARQDWLIDWYESALETIHKRESELGITPEAIQRQIKKIRGK